MNSDAAGRDRRLRQAAPAAPRPTILHLGVGAFHRAHQAAVLQTLYDTGDRAWRLVGGDLRDDQPDVEAALLAQHGAYTLETVAPDGSAQWQRIASIARIVPYAADHAALIDVGADPTTRIVSFTVTEAGYHLGPDGTLDASSAAIAADAAAVRAGGVGRTVYGVLAAILRERRERRSGRLSLLCCDNLRHGGTRVRDGLLSFLALAGEHATWAWVLANTTSPNAMVDRITPRPPPELRARVRAMTGVDDHAPVLAESFLQWVIEDDFAAGRPAWEAAGVELVADVAPYEEAKIRLLNASHSVLAWGGALVGHAAIHPAARDPRLRAIAAEAAHHDVFPCLRPTPVDLPAYLDAALWRFGNAALGDTVARVASDSFAKFAGFVAPTIRERLAAGASIAHVAKLPALLLAFLQRWDAATLGFTHVDRTMDPDLARAIVRAADPVEALCAQMALFGDAAGDARLVGAVREAFASLASLTEPAAAHEDAA